MDVGKEVLNHYKIQVELSNSISLFLDYTVLEFVVLKKF